MKFALAQLNYTIGDIDGNTSKIIAAVERAKREGADVVIFAEQAISGTPAFDLLRKTTFLELCEDALERIASHCDSIAAVVGSPILTTEGIQSAALVLEHGRIRYSISKQHITARREMGFLNGGDGMATVTIAGEKVAIVVGDDFRSIKRIDPNVRTLININARRYGKGVMSRRYDVIRNMAYVEAKNIIFVNQVGGSGEIVYDGTSGVMSADGNLILLTKSFEEDFGLYDTEANYPPFQMPDEFFRHDRTEQLYRSARLFPQERLYEGVCWSVGRY